MRVISALPSTANVTTNNIMLCIKHWQCHCIDKFPGLLGVQLSYYSTTVILRLRIVIKIKMKGSPATILHKIQIIKNHT